MGKKKKNYLILIYLILPTKLQDSIPNCPMCLKDFKRSNVNAIIKANYCNYFIH